MITRPTFVTSTQSLKGNLVNLYNHDQVRSTVAQWAMVRHEDSGIRYDFYRGWLRLGIEEYGVAVNQLSEPFFRRDRRYKTAVATTGYALVSDLVRVPQELCGVWPDTIPVLYERRWAPGGHKTIGLTELEEAVRSNEYGRIVNTDPQTEATVYDMIERRADPSEVREVLGILSVGG